MSPVVPYVACVVGAVGLYLLLRPAEGSPRRGVHPIKAAGILLALGAFGWLVVDVSRRIGLTAGTPDDAMRPGGMFMAFSLIALAAAVRMITHSRPVYSALYFVLVVLSSAGLFLLLQAEFMAFALVIVYAGAILITYMFVLMLAQQTPARATPGAAGGEPAEAEPEYDRVPREPGMAATVGFILLALFSHMIGEGTGALRAGPSPAAALQGGTQPTNIHLVGLDLVAKFPVSLELAGVILLLAMFGAVVLARKQIELGEDEVREAAGMRKLALHSDQPESEASTGGNA